MIGLTGVRLWVPGGTGLLGTPLVRRLREDGAEVCAGNAAMCDITRAEQVAAVAEEFAPHVVINCAAFTQVDACESREAEAMAVNADGAGNVAGTARRIGARLIHISTDYVFAEGSDSPCGVMPRRARRVDDLAGPPEALCAYGRTKLVGEQRVLQAHPEALIVRTAWLYGRDGPGFPQAILRQARAGGPLRVVDDQTGSPTYAEDVAEAIVRLIHAGADRTHRVVHVTNAGSATWCDFARLLVDLAGIKTDVIAISSAQSGRAARRPTWSVLDASLYEQLTNHSLRNWRDAAAAFMRDVLDSGRSQATHP